MEAIPDIFDLAQQLIFASVIFYEKVCNLDALGEAAGVGQGDRNRGETGTNVDIGATIAAVTAGIGLIAAKDAKPLLSDKPVESTEPKA